MSDKYILKELSNNNITIKENNEKLNDIIKKLDIKVNNISDKKLMLEL